MLMTDRPGQAASAEVGGPNAGPRIVFIGDSTATTFGSSDSRPIGAAYPDLIAEQFAADGWHVVSLARVGRALSASAARVDRIVALDPDVIVIAHGGRENLLRFPRLLKHLRVYPLGRPIPEGKHVPARLVRQLLFAPLLAMLQTTRGEVALRRVGIRPHLPPEAISAMYFGFVDALLAETDARIVVLSPGGAYMSRQPWSRTGSAKLHAALTACAADRPRVSFVNLRALTGRLDLFVEDGVHYSTVGHQVVADLVGAACSSALQPA